MAVSTRDGEVRVHFLELLDQAVADAALGRHSPQPAVNSVSVEISKSVLADQGVDLEAATLADDEDRHISAVQEIGACLGQRAGGLATAVPGNDGVVESIAIVAVIVCEQEVPSAPKKNGLHDIQPLVVADGRWAQCQEHISGASLAGADPVDIALENVKPPQTGRAVQF